LPFVDDSGNTATVVSEGGVSSTTDEPIIGGVALGVAPTYRSGLIRVSTELLQDSSVDILGLLNRSFGVRLTRAIGAACVSSLLGTGGATLGQTAASSSAVGIDDLLGLMGSLNPVYLSNRTFWFMNWSTYIGLLKVKDSANRPIIPPMFNGDGFRHCSIFRLLFVLRSRMLRPERNLLPSVTLIIL